MWRFLFVGLVISLFVQLAASQVRLAFTAHDEGKPVAQPTTVLAKGCEARIEDPDLEKMYMLLRDCGKTLIGVSVEDKAVITMPPIKSSFAQDIQTAAVFMQGHPRVSVEKLEEKSGENILGRKTTYFSFNSKYSPDPKVSGTVNLIVKEEFWIDSTLDIPVLESMFGKSPDGEDFDEVRKMFALMKGFPLRHRSAVTVVRSGVKEVQAPFVQEVVSLSNEPFDESVFAIPNGFTKIDAATAQ